MDKLNSIRPNGSVQSEVPQIQERLSDKHPKPTNSSAAVNDTRPNLNAESAEEFASSLGTRVGGSPGSAIEALGNMDEERIRALLEE